MTRAKDRHWPPSSPSAGWAACLVASQIACAEQPFASVDPSRDAASVPAADAAADADAGTPVFAPASGRRLTKDQYFHTVSDLFRMDLSGSDNASLLPDDQPATGGGFRDDNAALLPATARTDTYELLATQIADRVPWDTQLAPHVTCTDATADCREHFIRSLGRMVYRRPLTDDDVQNLEPLFDVDGPGNTAFETGARLVLQAMLQSPHFLYRLERRDAIDASGQPAPTPFEMATRLSFLLWSSTPTSELLDAAERGELATEESIARTVQLMSADGRARQGFESYVEDWLQLYRLNARTPTPNLGVTLALIGEMKQEAFDLFERVALTETRDFTQIFTDRKTVLGPALAQVYGVEPPARGFAQYDLSSDPHRLGILTQPGFLILAAAPEHVTIVERGLMILRVFLCTEVPAPPPGAAAQIANVPGNLTDRERFLLHANSGACKGCHDTIDPVGFPFEPYDLAGRFRLEDSYGNSLRSDGAVSLDGRLQPYADTAQFAELLAHSADVHRCLMTKLFEYAMGRSLQTDPHSSDQTTIDELTRVFEGAGRTYGAALTWITTSPPMRTQAVAP
jgi:hypothetical protein